MKAASWLPIPPPLLGKKVGSAEGTNIWINGRQMNYTATTCKSILQASLMLMSWKSSFGFRAALILTKQTSPDTEIFGALHFLMASREML